MRWTWFLHHIVVDIRSVIDMFSMIAFSFSLDEWFHLKFLWYRGDLINDAGFAFISCHISCFWNTAIPFCHWSFFATALTILVKLSLKVNETIWKLLLHRPAWWVGPAFYGWYPLLSYGHAAKVIGCSALLVSIKYALGNCQPLHSSFASVYLVKIVSRW